MVATYYYLYDALGSTERLTNASQTTTDTYSYPPFGTSVGGAKGATTNWYGWLGRIGYQYDGFGSLLAVRARRYDYNLGRWISQDPLESDWHSYRYVGNNPINATDPSGESVLDAMLAGNVTPCGSQSLTVSIGFGATAINQVNKDPNGVGCALLTLNTLRAGFNDELRKKGYPKSATSQTGCPPGTVCCNIVSTPVGLVITVNGKTRVQRTVLRRKIDCTVTFPVNVVINGTYSIGVCATPPCQCAPVVAPTAPPLLVPTGITIDLDNLPTS